MIYTVTLNPALDYVISVPDINAKDVVRGKCEKINAGGKGINVSAVLKRLGVDSTVLGFTGGFVGEEIEKKIKELGCICKMIRLEKGCSRINVKIKGQKELEINVDGPEVYETDAERLFKIIDCLVDGDILVIAGSIPQSLSSAIYYDMADRIKNKKIKVIVDTSGEALLKMLKLKPFLVKPNNFELEDMFGIKIENEDNIFFYAKELQKMGAENVFVSLGKNGGILITNDGRIIKEDAPDGKVLSTTGAGDSAVAGFIYGLLNKMDYEDILKFSLACGSATAFSYELATKDEIFRVYYSIK